MIVGSIYIDFISNFIFDLNARDGCFESLIFWEMDSLLPWLLSHNNFAIFVTVLCFNVKFSIKFTSLIKLYSSEISSSEGLSKTSELITFVTNKQILVAKLPPCDVFDLFKEDVSSVEAKLNYFAP